MPECGAAALGPVRGRLEWLGPIAPERQESSLPTGTLGRALDMLDIMAASALTALFAAARKTLR